jgi:O-antigen/teichoic acid export membrane protein
MTPPAELPESPRSYGTLAKRGLVWGLVRDGAKFLIVIPTGMVMARLLSPHESGVAAAAYFVMQLGGRLTQFGLGVSLVRAKTVTDAHVSSVFVLNLLAGCAASGLFALVGPSLGGLIGSREAAALLPIAGLGFLIGAFGSVPTALLARAMRYREGATSELLGVVVYAISIITLAWLGFSYWSVVYGILLGDAVRIVCRMWMSRFVPHLAFSREAAHEILSFGLGIYVKNLLEYCARNIDNLIVGRLLGMTPLGYYDKAFSTVSKLSDAINLAGPSVSLRTFALMQDDLPRFRRAYGKVILSVSLVGYPVIAGVAVVGQELVTVMFGQRWQPAALPLQILCVAAMLRQVNYYASSATQAKGYIWSEVRGQALAVVVLAAAVAWLSRWGIAGAAVGVLLSTLASTIWLQLLVRRLAMLTWSDLLLPQVPGLLCAACTVIAAVVVRQLLMSWLGAPPALTVLIACAAAGGAGTLAFLLFAPFDAMQDVVREILKDLGLRFVLARLPVRPTASR